MISKPGLSNNGAIVDFAVIGSGIAGASVAFELSASGASVIVLEAEDHPGYHTTGRSAAFYMAAYGNDVVRAITLASKSFYQSPPAGFCEVPLLRPCGAMYIAREEQLPQLHALYQRVSRLLDNVEIVDKAFVLSKVPELKSDYVAAGFWEPTSMEIDVAALLEGYIKFAKRQGVEFVFNAQVKSLQFSREHWVIGSSAGQYQAKHIINAAGAWGDVIAGLAGARSVGLVPKRRTVCIVKSPDNIDVRGWPLTLDIDEKFYFKPDGGNILITPGDETPMEPMDAYPEEIDIALGVERFQQAVGIKVNRVLRTWAGLRTFVKDKSPVVGFDSKVPQFFWLVGQGGYGIQMAPALSKIAASLAINRGIPQFDTAMRVTADSISPARI